MNEGTEETENVSVWIPLLPKLNTNRFFHFEWISIGGIVHVYNLKSISKTHQINKSTLIGNFYRMIYKAVNIYPTHTLIKCVLCTIALNILRNKRLLLCRCSFYCSTSFLFKIIKSQWNISTNWVGWLFLLIESSSPIYENDEMIS